MDVYFRHFADHYTVEEVADRLCMSVDRVKELKKAMEMRDKMKDVKVTAAVQYKTDGYGPMEVKEEKTLDFDVVRPSSFVVISHAPKEKQEELLKEAAEKNLSFREVQAKVKEANIEAGNKITIAKASAPQLFECPLCGSKISQSKFREITEHMEEKVARR